MPLVVTHGWPSSFFEMTKIIPRLSDPSAFGGDPSDSFDVVVPSMPGYGFSAQTRRRGVNTRHIAGLWDQLMTQELGYGRYATQGGDWGAGVTARLGYHHSDHVLGIHVTSVTQAIPYQGEGSRPWTTKKRPSSNNARNGSKPRAVMPTSRAPSPRPYPTASTTRRWASAPG